VVVGRWRRNHDVTGDIGRRQKGDRGCCSLSLCARTLTHPDRTEGRRNRRGDLKFARASSASRDLPDSVTRGLIRGSIVTPNLRFFFPSSFSSLRRARRRASLREPQQQCSAVVQSRECTMDVAERMLRSRGEKGDCWYIREACTIPPVFMA